MIVDVLADYGIPQRLAQITIIGFVAAGIIGYFWRIIVIGVILVSIISIFATGSTRPRDNAKVDSSTSTVQTVTSNADVTDAKKDVESDDESDKKREEKELEDFVKTLPPVRAISEEEQYIRDCKKVANYTYNECKKLWILKHD